jgi:hypothetical protein
MTYKVLHGQNGNITYQAKGGVGDVETFSSLSDLRGTNYTVGTATHYKLKQN